MVLLLFVSSLDEKIMGTELGYFIEPDWFVDIRLWYRIRVYLYLPLLRTIQYNVHNKEKRQLGNRSHHADNIDMSFV